MRKIWTSFLVLILCWPIIASAKPVPKATKVPKVSSSTINQYAGSPFDPDKTSNHSVNVFEKGNYTLVYWLGGGKSGEYKVYMSAAKNEKWLFRGKVVHTISRASSRNTMFLNNFLFYKDSEGLQVVEFNMENGGLISQKLIDSIEEGVKRDTRILKAIKTVDQQGVLYGPRKNGDYMIYLEKQLDKPITIYNPRGTLKATDSRMKSEIILSAKRDQLIFLNNNSATIFNINKQDFIYDPKGKVKDFLKSKRYRFDKRTYLRGEIFEFDHYEKSVTVYNEQFKQLRKYQMPEMKEEYLYNNNITRKGSTLRIWEKDNNKNTNSLKVVTLKFGK